MKKSLWQESFVPVMLVVLAIALGLLFVEYKVNQEADLAIVIDIPAVVDTGDVDEEDGAGDDEDFQEFAASSDPEQTLIVDLIKARKWSKAEEILGVRIASEGSSIDYAFLGIVMLKKQHYQESLDALSQAVKVKPLYASAYFYRGLVHSKLGNYKQAVRDYKHLIALMPYHFEAHYNLGLAQRKLHDDASALATLEHALKLSSGKRKAKVYYSLGLIYADKGEQFVEQARKSYETAIRLRPDYILPRLGLASLEPDSPEGHRNALAYYETVLRLKPDYAPAHFRMGLSYSGLDDVTASVAAYKKAIRFKPSYLKAHYNLGLQLIKAKQWSEATEQFMWILERKPEHARSYFNLARIAVKKGDSAAAIEKYNSAIKLRKGNYPEAYVNMGLLHLEGGDVAKAIKSFEQAIALRPDYAQAWYHKGDALGKKDASQAVDALQKAVKYNARLTEAWERLGEIYAAQGEISSATQAYEQALQIEEHQNAQLALAALYEEQGRVADAVKIYDAVLVKYPSFVLAWQKLGELHARHGDADKAEQAFMQALTQDEGNIEVKRALALLKFEKGHLEEAVDLFTQAIEALPSDVGLRADYAEALMKSGRVNEAKSEIEKGLLLQPDHVKLQQLSKSLAK